MAYRRIAYAALLGGAVLFQIVFRFYLSTFTLALVLLLPLLSVLLSLPSVLGCTLLLTPAAPTVVQGEDAVFQVRLRSRTRLPLPRLQARLHWSNQLTGAGGRVRWEPVRTAPGAPPTLELATPHCGRLVCRAERAWTCDLLGLFPLPIPTGRPAAVLILPPDMEQALPERLLGGGPGGGADGMPITKEALESKEKGSWDKAKKQMLKFAKDNNITVHEDNEMWTPPQMGGGGPM